MLYENLDDRVLVGCSQFGQVVDGMEAAPLGDELRSIGNRRPGAGHRNGRILVDRDVYCAYLAAERPSRAQCVVGRAAQC